MDKTSIDFVHNNFPIDMLTTGSSGPILIATVPSSNPKHIILEFSFETSILHARSKLYSSVF